MNNFKPDCELFKKLVFGAYFEHANSSTSSLGFTGRTLHKVPCFWTVSPDATWKEIFGGKTSYNAKMVTTTAVSPRRAFPSRAVRRRQRSRLWRARKPGANRLSTVFLQSLLCEGTAHIRELNYIRYRFKNYPKNWLLNEIRIPFKL